MPVTTERRGGPERRRSGWPSISAFLVAVVAAMPAVSQAQAILTPDEVSTELAQRLGVEVLNVEPADRDGDPVLIVTVMEPGGNSNSAFVVTRLAVDARTGRFSPAGRESASPERGGPFWSDPGTEGITVRRRTFAR